MRLLQIFSFKKSAYERPNQKWICGRSCDPCLPGPDRHGNCQATFECRPLKQGDRWQCTRPASQGGPCESGPLPNGVCCRVIPKCRPVMALRAWRGQAVLVIAAATCSAIILTMTVNPELSQTIFSPGPLSFQHSTYKSQCSDCHINASAKTPALVWLRSSASAPDRQHANSLACLKCHNLGPDSFAVHALPQAQLDEISVAASREKSTAAGPWTLRVGAALGGNPKSRPSSRSCEVCHVEHLGKQSNLIRISDLQCQTCHGRQFASFSDGHPAFNAYPFRRRTRIQFDHRSHIQDHFKEDRFSKLAPASCSSCHAPDSKGGAMLVRSFEETCASCHLDQIKGRGQAAGPGIAVLRLPGLDVQTLASHGINIGAWPDGADGQMTPFMEWLLPNTNLAGIDLLDLSKATAAQLNSAAEFAWSIKEMIFDLSEKGQPELERRVKAALRNDLSSQRSQAIAGLLSPDVIQAMRRKWFPNLDSEVAQHRSGNKTAPVPN